MNALVKVGDSAGNPWVGSVYYPLAGPQPGTVGTGLGEGSSPSSPGLTAVTGTRPADYTAFLSDTSLVGKKLVMSTFTVAKPGTPTAVLV